jgi:hypothetical protein
LQHINIPAEFHPDTDTDAFYYLIYKKQYFHFSGGSKISKPAHRPSQPDRHTKPVQIPQRGHETNEGDEGLLQQDLQRPGLGAEQERRLLEEPAS